MILEESVIGLLLGLHFSAGLGKKARQSLDDGLLLHVVELLPQARLRDRDVAEVERADGRIAELERKIGQQALEIDFLKGCLQRIEEQRMLQALTGNPRSTGRSKKK